MFVTMRSRDVVFIFMVAFFQIINNYTCFAKGDKSNCFMVSPFFQSILWCHRYLRLKVYSEDT